MSPSEKYHDPDEQELEVALKDYDLQGLDFTYSEAKTTLLMQFENVKSLDAKASIILGFDGLIIVSLLTVWSSFFKEASSPVLAFVIISSIALAISALYCLRAYSCRIYKGAPSSKRLFEKYVTWEPTNIKYITTGVILKAIKFNDNVIARKFRLVKYALRATLIGIVTYVLAFIINIF